MRYTRSKMKPGFQIAAGASSQERLCDGVVGRSVENRVIGDGTDCAALFSWGIVRPC